MNQIGEKIQIDKLVCREIYLPELKNLLQSNIYVFFSWGCENITVDNENKIRMFRMTVNGYKHKGYVYIFLNGGDLFDVVLTTKKDIIVDKTDEMGLYFDQLVEWIDEKIEKQPDYIF